ncbi:putative aminopeptidase W07G4.4 [Fasciola hepatica]|uniref:Aminopeptidase W07G4.4 n=1 Tax=Fasciola hepatica TaxID=6192 RepID=A0A4E0R9M5_FASHE|nr:putative aminopeptidase W07G4.4 [Fasciola hepatica]
MCPSKILSFLKVELSGGGVLLDAQPVDEKRYPLAAVVDRGSSNKNRGSIVHLEYSGSRDGNISDSELQNLFLIGKGIVYDSGGYDLKVGGNMATMHRDKCGAAAVAGFFKILNLLKPANINVRGSLAFVRNSIGENAYVSDEIITSRAGVRVRVTNTDAEGRMVMTDLLCEAKEKVSFGLSNTRFMLVYTRMIVVLKK